MLADSPQQRADLGPPHARLLLGRGLTEVPQSCNFPTVCQGSGLRGLAGMGTVPDCRRCFSPASILLYNDAYPHFGTKLWPKRPIKMPASIWTSIASRWPGCPSCWADLYSPRNPPGGGFAGLFQLDFTNHLFARNKDGPGAGPAPTAWARSSKVAVAVGKHDTVGIDLVAMSVNDALCCGAEPLFFLDYVAMPKDDPDLLEQLVEGITDGCIQADCALLGGETAILPDLYAPGDYDLAGFCVGVAAREQVIDGSAIAAGRRGARAWPPPACTPTATASPARSSSTSPASRSAITSRSLAGRSARPCLDADADLRPAGAAGADLLSREERRARHRPHHRRRPAREPRPHRARKTSQS